MSTGEVYMGEVIHKMSDGRTMHWRPMPGAPMRVATIGGGKMELREDIVVPGGKRIGKFKSKGAVRIAREDPAEEAFRPMQRTRIETEKPGLAAKLYVGLNVGADTVWSDKDVEEAVLTVRKEQGEDPGASILLQLGIYEQEGVPVEEPSVAVGIIDMHHTPKDVWERQMQELAAALRERFSQDSILVEMQENGRTTQIFQARGPLGPWLNEGAG
jgi:hypothetical protein